MRGDTKGVGYNKWTLGYIAQHSFVRRSCKPLCDHQHKPNIPCSTHFHSTHPVRFRTQALKFSKDARYCKILSLLKGQLTCELYCFLSSRSPIRCHSGMPFLSHQRLQTTLLSFLFGAPQIQLFQFGRYMYYSKD